MVMIKPNTNVYVVPNFDPKLYISFQFQKQIERAVVATFLGFFRCPSSLQFLIISLAERFEKN